jgi:hypothetical protein
VEKIKEWNLPILTVSEANSSEHWTKKHKRHRIQKGWVSAAMRSESKEIDLPCHIKLTRLAPRILDKDDNLPMAFKFIKDQISDELIPGKAAGLADDDPRLSWSYDQQKSKEKSVKIEIFSLGD